MSLLIESIKVLDGKVYNLEYHQQRLEESQKVLFGQSGQIDLHQAIQIPLAYRQGLVKCRVLYDQEIHEITYNHYQPRVIRSLKMVFDNNIDYALKWDDRQKLNNLYSMRGKCDDVVIVKNNLLTDTIFGNIALYDGSQWFTPRRPLLKGTQREKILKNSLVYLDDLSIYNLDKFVFIRVFNAMNEFDDQIMLPISSIVK